MTTPNLSFVLHDRFALSHFDLRHNDHRKPYMRDLRDAEKLINQIAFLASSQRDEHKRCSSMLRAWLSAVDKLTQVTLHTVLANTQAVDALYRDDVLTVPQPPQSTYTCVLRWDDRRVWAMVRGLIAIDTASLQLYQLHQRGLFDLNEFKRRRDSLSRSWREGLLAIFKQLNDLDEDSKRLLHHSAGKRPHRNEPMNKQLVV